MYSLFINDENEMMDKTKATRNEADLHDRKSDHSSMMTWVAEEKENDS